MSLTTQTDAVKLAIQTLGTKIREISVKAENAPDAQKLEGNTLQDIVDLISGTTGLTIQEVQNQLDTFIARSDNPHGVTKAQVGLGSLENYGIATKVEVEAGTVTNKYVTPKLVSDALTAFWADQVGTAPETLDTINEIATAITTNQDVIDTLNDAVANRAKTTDLNSAISDLEGSIAALTKADIGLGSVDNFATATNPEAVTGTAADKFMTPASTKAATDALKSDLEGQIGGKADQTDLDGLQSQVTGLEKADVGLDKVENHGIATEPQALETDTGLSSNASYMTPARTLAVRKAIEAEVNASLADLESAFQDAIAAIDPPVGP